MYRTLLITADAKRSFAPRQSAWWILEFHTCCNTPLLHSGNLDTTLSSHGRILSTFIEQQTRNRVKFVLDGGHQLLFSEIPKLDRTGLVGYSKVISVVGKGNCGHVIWFLSVLQEKKQRFTIIETQLERKISCVWLVDQPQRQIKPYLQVSCQHVVLEIPNV